MPFRAASIPWHRRPAALAAAVVLLVAAGALHVTRTRPGQPRHASGAVLDELDRLQVERRFAPMLSIGVRHRACVMVPPESGTVRSTRCGGLYSTPAPAEERAGPIAGRAARALRQEISPASLHAVGLVDLLWTDPTGNSLDRSITHLRMAARLTDSPAPAAPILADLAASYLVRAERKQSPRDLVAGLDVAASVADGLPGATAASFNFTLAARQLGLSAEAARSMGRLRAADSSMWADDAVLAATDTAPPSAPPPHADERATLTFVRDAPGEAREHGWSVLLPAWGDAVLARDSARAVEALAAAERVGRALEAQGGDATLADAVRTIAAHGDDPSATRALAAAHREYGRGQDAYRRLRRDSASAAFARAAAEGRRSTTLHDWATLFHAAALVYRGDRARGEPLLRRLAERTDTARHPALAARTRWALGVTRLRSGDPRGAAIARTALPLYARIGEREHLGALYYVLAEAAFDVGDAATGYVELHRALQLLRPYPISVWRHNALWMLARAAAQDGFLNAALVVQREGIDVADRLGPPEYAVEARLAHARLLTLRGQPAGDEAALAAAAAELRLARTTVMRLPAEARAWFLAELGLSEAILLARRHPATALAALDVAVDFYRRTEHPVPLLPALVARAESRLRLGDGSGALHDLNEATGVVLRRHDAIARDPSGPLLLAAARGIFERVALLHVAGGRPVEALEHLERGRASLAPITTRGEYAGVRSIPPDETVLDLALVGDTLLAWTVTGSAIGLYRATVPRASLLQTIEQLRVALELHATEEEVRPQLERLHAWLIAPAAARLGRTGTLLTIVADGALADVPFAALRNGEDGRYLIQDRPLRVLPTLRDAVARRSVGGGTSHAPRHAVLLVSNATVDRSTMPGLAPLPAAEREIRDVGALYDDAVVLSGDSATWSRTRRLLRSRTLLHFAGHAVADDERPEQSFLAFAPDSTPSADGRVTAAQVLQHDLRHVRLVVLSACETQRSASGHAGGFGGLAGAFVAAGAQGVVGTLWRVRDDLTRSLMVDFHRAFRTVADGPAALRAAQLQALQSDDPARRSPAAWAGLRYAGR